MPARRANINGWPPAGGTTRTSPVTQGELEGAGAALELSHGFVRETYKAGHPKVTGPATKKRGVKNEKCQTIMLTCPSRGSIGTLPWDGPIIPYPARALVNKFATICNQMMNEPLTLPRRHPEIDIPTDV